ncbi:MarR family winged helix-turn-helix transcriptional regulator [Gordonia sp. 'Campus']|uniref:MarR family winged helix-turn-helix transcriptional regulator n=1 Tax=Gordonia sp. 'Campus' TaxID=2915824 RepID=UPI001EE4590A|nr:MarR family transcriptional regulator [Gordonia sp. 'Campus']
MLTVAEAESWLNLVDGGWALFARVNDEFGKRGLSVADLRILEAVCRARQPGVSEVADAVHMRVSTVSRMIARLSNDGDIQRLESKADGRHRLVRLTDQGRRTLADHVSVRDRVIRQFVVDAMSPDEFAALGVAFRKIRAAVDAADPPVAD